MLDNQQIKELEAMREELNKLNQIVDEGCKRNEELKKMVKELKTELKEYKEEEEDDEEEARKYHNKVSFGLFIFQIISIILIILFY